MRRVPLLLVTVLSATLLLVPAPSTGVKGGAVFNKPRPYAGEAGNYKIVRVVKRAIDQTRPTKKHPKPVIHISTYLLDWSPAVTALIKACRRGVQVRVILDEDIKNKNSRRLITALNADNVPDKNKDGKPDRDPRAGPCNRPLRGGSGGLRTKSPGRSDPPAVDQDPDSPQVQDPEDPEHTELDLFTTAEAERSVSAPRRDSVTWGRDGSYVKRCKGACRGKGGNMHSKFYLFSRSKKARHVVMVSSSNLNRGGARLGWNDMYVVKGRKKLYRGFRDMHRLMTDDVRSGGKKVEVKDGRYRARFFPMRNAKKKNDPTLQDLKRIKCRSGFGRTQVHISMFYWKGKRGAYLLNKVRDLARAGCKVRVIYGAPSVKLATRMRGMAGRGLIDLWDSRWDYNDDGWSEVRTHAKYVLVKGTIGKNRRSFAVWTGSQNWVGGSLSRSDEVTLNIRGKSAYKKYRKNWVTIRKHSRRLPYSKYPR